MRYEYKTENTCSQIISFDIDGNVITNIEFYGGCNGNLKAIARLLDGAAVEEIEKSSSGIPAVAVPPLAQISLHALSEQRMKN